MKNKNLKLLFVKIVKKKLVWIVKQIIVPDVMSVFKKQNWKNIKNTIKKEKLIRFTTSQF